MVEECGVEALDLHPLYMSRIISANEIGGIDTVRPPATLATPERRLSDCAIGFMISIFPLGVAAWQFGTQETRSTKYTVFLFERQGSVTLGDPGCIVPSVGHVGFLVGLLKFVIQLSRSLFG